jgi:hypothetical protein
MQKKRLHKLNSMPQLLVMFMANTGEFLVIYADKNPQLYLVIV